LEKIKYFIGIEVVHSKKEVFYISTKVYCWFVTRNR